MTRSPGDCRSTSFLVAIRMQALLLGRARSPVLAAISGALVLLSSELVMQASGVIPGGHPHLGLRLIWVTGVVWGFLIWRDEAPPDRVFYDCLPTTDRQGDLARIAGGAMWLVLILLILLTAIAFRSFSSSAELLATLGSMGWAAMASLLAYCLAASYTTAVNRPGEKLLVAALVWVIISFASALVDSTAWIDGTEAVLLRGHAALGTVLSGTTHVDTRWLGLSLWSLFAAVSISAAAGRRVRD